MSHVALIAGSPGCGKTTFMKWLASHQQYLFVDMDRDHEALQRAALCQLSDRFYSGTDRESSIVQLRKSPKVVLDWNFPPDAVNLGAVTALKERGAEMWWFEGDRLAARERFLERATDNRGNFDYHVGRICTTREFMAPLIGTNIVRTIAADGVFLSHENILRRFVPSESITSGGIMALESFRHWQGRSIDQKQITSTLMLGLSGGALAFSVSLLDKLSGYVGFRWSLIFHTDIGLHLLSMAAGIAFSLSRVGDFDLTAQIAREREITPDASRLKEMRRKVRRWGRSTRRLYLAQALLFVAAVLAFLVTAATRYKFVLYP